MPADREARKREEQRTEEAGGERSEESFRGVRGFLSSRPNDCVVGTLARSAAQGVTGTKRLALRHVEACHFYKFNHRSLCYCYCILKHTNLSRLNK